MASVRKESAVKRNPHERQYAHCIVKYNPHDDPLIVVLKNGGQKKDSKEHETCSRQAPSHASTQRSSRSIMFFFCWCVGHGVCEELLSGADDAMKME